VMIKKRGEERAWGDDDDAFGVANPFAEGREDRGAYVIVSAGVFWGRWSLGDVSTVRKWWWWW
jgi:hypothetical protein